MCWELTRSFASPDGSLVLEVGVLDEGEGRSTVLVAFVGGEWHVHGELIVGMYGDTPMEAALKFADTIVSGTQWVVVWTGDDGSVDYDVTEDPVGYVENCPSGFGVEIRRWSGERYVAIGDS